MTHKKIVFHLPYQVKMITTKHEIEIKINYQDFISQISSCNKLPYHSPRIPRTNNRKCFTFKAKKIVFIEY